MRKILILAMAAMLFAAACNKSEETAPPTAPAESASEAASPAASPAAH